MKLNHKLLCTLAALALSGCHSVDIKNNIVYGPVYVPFTTVADWDVYGVGAALDTRRFVRWTSTPAGYPYQDYCFTGFGGVLLACTIGSEPVAYDLACPVEHSQSVTVVVNRESNFAECPKCGSVYDVFELEGAGGYPVSGRALEEGYGLTPYRVVFGVDGKYALITQ